MESFDIGNIIKVQVIGIRNYGIFVKSVDNEEYTGLIHISEISASFVKNIYNVAQINDIVFAKILDVDHEKKQIKLSIKALAPRSRYKSSIYKVEDNNKADFSLIEEKLESWIEDQLQEKKNG